MVPPPSYSWPFGVDNNPGLILIINHLFSGEPLTFRFEVIVVDALILDGLSADFVENIEFLI